MPFAYALRGPLIALAALSMLAAGLTPAAAAPAPPPLTGSVSVTAGDSVFNVTGTCTAVLSGWLPGDGAGFQHAVYTLVGHADSKGSTAAATGVSCGLGSAPEPLELVGPQAAYAGAVHQ